MNNKYIYNDNKLHIADCFGNYKEREIVSNNMKKILELENDYESINGLINSVKLMICNKNKMLGIGKFEKLFILTYPLLLTLIIILILIITGLTSGLLYTSLLCLIVCSLINVPTYIKNIIIKRELKNLEIKLDKLEEYKKIIGNKLDEQKKDNNIIDHEKIDLDKRSVDNVIGNSNYYNEEILNYVKNNTNKLVLSRKKK